MPAAATASAAQRPGLAGQPLKGKVPLAGALSAAGGGAAGERALPRIPQYGLASRIQPEVLISTVVDTQAVKLGSRTRKLQHNALPEKLPGQGQKSIAEQIRVALYQKDSATPTSPTWSALRGSDHAAQRELGLGGLSALGCSAGTLPGGLGSGLGETGSEVDALQAGLSVELPSTFSIDHGSCATASVAGGLGGCMRSGGGAIAGSGSLFGGPSLGHSEAASTLRLSSCTPRAVGSRASPRPAGGGASGGGDAAGPGHPLSCAAAALRARHLKESFVNSQADIQARLTQLDEHLKRDRPVQQKVLVRLPTMMAMGGAATDAMGISPRHASISVPSGVEAERSARRGAKAAAEEGGERAGGGGGGGGGSVPARHLSQQVRRTSESEAPAEAVAAAPTGVHSSVIKSPPASSRPWQEEASTIQSAEWPNFARLFQDAKTAQLNKVAPKTDAARGATREELIYACDMLNLMRSLCGLHPVELEKECIYASDLLNQALLPREEVFLPQQSGKWGHLSHYAEHLAGFMSAPGRSIVLHKETSLINCISSCLMCTHAAGLQIAVSGDEESTVRLGGNLGRVSYDAEAVEAADKERSAQLQAIRERAERYRRLQPPVEPPALNTKLLSTISLMERGRLPLGSLPPVLRGLRPLWFLNEGENTAYQQFLGGLTKLPSGKPAARVALRDATSAKANLAAAAVVAGLQLSPPSSARSASSSRSVARGGGRRIRKIEWGENAPKREKDKARACTLCWGDRTGAATFRRFLLNPALRRFGASRMQDTCVIWTGEDPHLARKRFSAIRGTCGDSVDGPDIGPGVADGEAPHSPYSDDDSDPSAQSEPDIVCFPPPGLFPHEMLLGRVPLWTVMPASYLFQPTQNLQVRMWRVRLLTASPPGGGVGGGAPTGAERLQEVTLELLSCDCSQKGNPFCILFRPAISFIADGDQFEVEVSGLRGHETSRYFFHEFRSFRADCKDHHLLVAAKQTCGMLDNPALWRSPQTFVGGKGSEGEDKGLSGSGLVPGRAAMCTSEADSLVIEIGLVSHPNVYISTDTHDVTISLWCPEAAAIRAHLYLVRVSGSEEVKRATVVLRIGEYFLIRVKLPMAQCRYELTFWVALKKTPEDMCEHPLRYFITSTEACQNLLISLEHPLKEKFGYSLQPPAVQELGVTVLAPMLHRVHAGYVYFLAYIDPEAHQNAASAAEENLAAITAAAESAAKLSRQNTGEQVDLGNDGRGTSLLFRERLAAGMRERHEVAGAEAARDMRPAIPGKKGQQKTAKAGRKGFVRQETVRSDQVPVVHTLYSILASKLEDNVQACHNTAHVDVSLVEAATNQTRYVLRLHQRADLPEFHDGLFFFGELDVAAKIEMHLHLPLVQAFPPLKIAEWLIVRKDEHFPIGF